MGTKREHKVPNVEKIFYSQNSYCGNAGYSGWSKKIYPEIREWRGQKICPSCVLKAYQKGEVDIYPVPETVKCTNKQ